MLNTVAERYLQRIRWMLLIGWVLVLVCLFNDSLSHWMTSADNLQSPWRLVSDRCVPLQDTCLAAKPYHMAIPIFWSYVVPGSILILLVCGHEVWRRICPLAFISHLPSLLGLQRRTQKGKSAKPTPVKIAAKSWLGRNYLYLQFGLLYLGVCARLLFTNADALALGIWLAATMLASLIVGFLYAGKSWCQYFCPMAPVQKVFSQPTGILTSKAHIEAVNSISQSMCRTIAPAGQEKSACVGCQKLCMDIDAEKNYWESISHPAYRLLHYGYVGLVIGFFTYHYVYAGNWEYFFSGIWARQTGQIGELMNPGFYLWDQVRMIPKLIAAPLYIALWIGIAYGVGLCIEKVYLKFASRFRTWSRLNLKHHLYSVATFVAFNIFFLFVGQAWSQGWPLWGRRSLSASLLIVSIFWLYRMTRRSPERYAREQLTERFRRQLAKRNVLLPRSWKQRRTENLSMRDMVLLIQTIPGYQPAQGEEIYQQMLDEIFAEMDGTITARIKLVQLRAMRKTVLAMMASQIHIPLQQNAYTVEPESSRRKSRRSQIWSEYPAHTVVTEQLCHRSVSNPEVWHESE